MCNCSSFRGNCVTHAHTHARTYAHTWCKLLSPAGEIIKYCKCNSFFKLQMIYSTYSKVKNSKWLDIGKNLDWGATTFTLLGLKFSVDLSSIVKINYTPVLQSLERLFHVWSKSHLTPLGKIAVIKN